MFMHKIGTILVNSIDSMIISVFVGIVALSKYSNYALIASVMSGTLSLFFSPLTSIVGHLCAKGVVNLTLSLIFVKTFPADYRVVGVIAAGIMLLA